jgi:hypothetical protein
MMYDDSEDRVVTIAEAARRAERDLPEPFSTNGADEDWYSDERQVEDWTSRDLDTFAEAADRLPVGSLRAGIRLAERVHNEHIRRSEQAARLGAMLREHAIDAGNYGREQQATKSQGGF